MNTDYHNPLIKQLRDQQVRVALAREEARAGQPGRETAGRARSEPQLPLRVSLLSDHRISARDGRRASLCRAKTLAHDLRLFVEDVSDAADVRAEDAGEPVHTVEELSKMFNVSTKTISRWREQGLVSRRFLFDGKRKRVGFLRSSVERFVAHEHRARAPRRAVQPADATKSGATSSSGPGGWCAPAAARRRWPGASRST